MNLHPNDLIDAVLFVVILIPSVMLHEVAHGAVAFALGDTTARHQGRLSLNPVRHVDPVGSLLVPGLLALSGQNVFGWAKPVPVDPSGMRRPVGGMALAAIAGPVTNLSIALLVGLLGPFERLGDGLVLEGSGLGGRIMLGLLLVNASLSVFNMLPIPPLDGSRLLPLVLPPVGRRAYARLAPYGFVALLMLVLVFDQALSFLGDWIRWVARLAV